MPSDAVGLFFGRGFGAFLLALASGHFLNGPSIELCKIWTVGAIAMMPCYIFALRDPDNFVDYMFKIQTPVHLIVTYFFAKGAGFF